MPKTNFITQLILEIKLAYYLSSFGACSGIRDHNESSDGLGKLKKSQK